MSHDVEKSLCLLMLHLCLHGLLLRTSDSLAAVHISEQGLSACLCSNVDLLFRTNNSYSKFQVLIIETIKYKLI